MVSQRFVAINAASSVLTRLLNVFGLLWMFQYLLARVPPEEFAVYPVVAAIMVFAPLFFSVFTGGISRYIVEAYATEDRERVSEIVSSIMPLLGGISLAFAAAGLTFAWFIDHVLRIPPEMLETTRLMMALLVVGFALRMGLLPFGVGHHVHQRYVELNLLGVARDVLRVGLMFVLLTNVSASVLWVVVAGAVADLAHLVAVIVRSVGFVPELRFRLSLVQKGIAGKLVSFGLWTTVGQLANMMYINAATLLLNIQGSAIDVTNYYLGSTAFRQIQTMISFAQQPLQTALIAMHARKEHERLARTALRGGRYGLWASLFVATPLVVLADDIVAIYIGAAFSDAALVLILFMVIFPFTQPTVLLPAIAMAQARVRIYNLAAMITNLSGLVLILLVGVENLGAVGVTAALTATTVLSQLAFFWRLQFRLVGLTIGPFLRRTLLLGLLPAFPTAAVLLGLKLVMPIQGWGTLILVVAGGSVAYLVTLAGFCLDAQDRDLARRALAKLRRR